MLFTILGKEITLDDALAKEASLHGLDLDSEDIAGYIKIQNASYSVNGNVLTGYAPADKKKIFTEKSGEELSEDLKKYIENHILNTKEMKDW